MALLSVSNLQIAFGDAIILDGVNMTLNETDHVGLVGRNGCGKSTLMKIIAGLGNLKPDAGQVQLARGATVGYLTQDPVLDPDHTLRDEASTAFAGLYELHQQLDDLTHKMADADGEALDKLLKRYEKVEHDMQAAGGYAVDHQIDATLHGLGLSDKFFNVKVRDLSGGQKGRLSLAKLLLSNPDLLLLDEPTNHLDIAGREWLEEYLATFRGAVILISHDRWLLDKSVSRIYELERGQSHEYPGSYRKFLDLRAERKAGEQRVFEKQQDRIRQERAFIDRYKAGQRAKQARGREKRLERFIDNEVTEQPYEEAVMAMNIKPPERSGDLVFTADRISKGYEGKQLFSDLSLIIRRGERVGIIGPNGAGKSTLVRCLLGDQPTDTGTVRIGSQLSIGHYHQTHEHMDQSLTVVEYLQPFTVGQTEQAARGLAGAFLFHEDEQDKPLSVLSGGERSRAALAALIVGGHNLLVLDEPTNHLDVQSSERLEAALRQFAGISGKAKFPGTLILITHDRMLLDDLVDQLLVLDGEGNIQHVHGTYSDYLAEQAKPAPPEVAKVSAKPPSSPPKQKPKNKSGSGSKGGGALSKLSDKALEQAIMEIEKSIQDLDAQLADPEVYRDGKKVKALQAKRNAAADELTPLEDEWTRRAEG